MKVRKVPTLDDELPVVEAIELGHHVGEPGTIEGEAVLYPCGRRGEVRVLWFRNRLGRHRDLFAGGEKDRRGTGGIGKAGRGSRKGRGRT